jgi:hypothetical protein
MIMKDKIDLMVCRLLVEAFYQSPKARQSLNTYHHVQQVVRYGAQLSLKLRTDWTHRAQYNGEERPT